MRNDGCDEELTAALLSAQKLIENRYMRFSNNRAATRRDLIEPVLRALGWDASNAEQVKCSPYEKSPHYRDRGVDYVLYVNGMKRVLIEAAPLDRVADAEMNIDDACSGTTYIGVATDGQTWTIWRDGSESSMRVEDEDVCRHLSDISWDNISGEAKRDEEKGVRVLVEKFNSRKPDCDHKRDAENANRAVRLLMDAVLDVKRGYKSDADAFYRMELAYLNTLNWASTKRVIRKRLEDIDGLDSQTRERIIRLSTPGRFNGIPRVIRPRDEEYRKEFLDLVELFLDPEEEYELLMKGFENFTYVVETTNPANLTGLLSSLRPDVFMPYNSRSVYPLKGTYYGYLDRMCMFDYRRFNDLYRSISEKLQEEISTWWILTPLRAVCGSETTARLDRERPGASKMPNDRPADHPCTAAAEKSWQAVGSCTRERNERYQKWPLRATPAGDPVKHGKSHTVTKTAFLNSNLEISSCQCVGSAGAPERTPERTLRYAPKPVPLPLQDCLAARLGRTASHLKPDSWGRRRRPGRAAACRSAPRNGVFRGAKTARRQAVHAAGILRIVCGQRNPGRRRGRAGVIGIR